MSIYFEREGEREKVGDGPREKGRERIPSRFCAVSIEPNSGLDLMNHEIMTGAEIESNA